MCTYRYRKSFENMSWEEDAYGSPGDIYEDDEFGDQDYPDEQADDAEAYEEDAMDDVIEMPEDMGDDDRKATFKELQNVQYGLGPKDTTKKGLRTAEDAALDQARGYISGGAFPFLDKKAENMVIDMLKGVKGIATLNVRTIVIAGIWKYQNSKLKMPENGDSFKAFIKKIDDPSVQPVDILRYIRLINVK